MAKNTNDPAKPNQIGAQGIGALSSPINLYADPSTVRVWLEEFGSAAKMGEYAALVHGRWRESDAVVRTISDGLFNPKAVFKGLDRPLFNMVDDADREVLIYITNPDATYEYPLASRFAGGPLRKLRKPVNSVFATYVSFQQSFVDERIADMIADPKPAGLIIGWEWVEESSKSPGLPYDYDSRFDVRVL